MATKPAVTEIKETEEITETENQTELLDQASDLLLNITEMIERLETLTEKITVKVPSKSSSTKKDYGTKVTDEISDLMDKLDIAKDNKDDYTARGIRRQLRAKGFSLSKWTKENEK